MDASTHDSGTDYDDDLPDFSTPEWVAKFDNAQFHPGEPIDLQSVRITHRPDGTTVVSYKLLGERDGADGADAEIPPTGPDKD